MKIECKTELFGEYNIKVLEKTNTIFESGWCKNTILSGGLSALYDNDITNLIKYLHLGTSREKPGTEGYGLTNIIQRSELCNIESSDIQTYAENISSRVYYSYFVTDPLPSARSSINLNEFGVGSKSDGDCFSRNVFLTSVEIEPGQYIVFEYRVKLNRYSAISNDLTFYTKDTSFIIPISSVSYSFPYSEVYRKDNQLMLLRNDEPLPQFGEKWPRISDYSIVNRNYSTFNATELSSSINHDTKTVTVSTAFYNVAATPIGLYNEINTLLLTRNISSFYPYEFNQEGFLATKLQFPLCLYNFINDKFDIYGIGDTVTEVPSRNNKLDFYVNYSWCEKK
jgi:hypothetical protein